MMGKKIIFLIIIGNLIMQSFSCAPVIGTRTLKDRSQLEKPRWIVTIPQSSRYQYFAGISSECSDLDKAKREAISDALNDAVSRQGVEVSIKYEKLDYNDKKELKDNISIGGVGQIGLEQVSWYWELWEIYYNQQVVPRYRVYSLMRSKKNHPDSWIKITYKNLSKRIDTSWHSMLIPGWGQFRLNKKGKGRFFLFTEILTLGGYGYFYYQYEKKTDDYDKLLFKLDKTIDLGTLDELEMSKYEIIRDRDRFKEYRNRFLYTSIGIYALNLLDALLFGTSSNDEFGFLKPKVYFTSEIKLKYFGIVANYNF